MASTTVSPSSKATSRHHPFSANEPRCLCKGRYYAFEGKFFLHDATRATLLDGVKSASIRGLLHFSLVFLSLLHRLTKKFLRKEREWRSFELEYFDVRWIELIKNSFHPYDENEISNTKVSFRKCVVSDSRRPSPRFGGLESRNARAMTLVRGLKSPVYPDRYVSNFNDDPANNSGFNSWRELWSTLDHQSQVTPLVVN